MGDLRYWPLASLEVRTPRLVLRVPTASELDALAGLAASGVHDAGRQPFTVAWTDAPAPDRARSVLQYHWRSWSEWKPEAWSLNFVAICDGVVIGTQEISAKEFAVSREVSTGSWLGQGFQGRGFGTEMRGAVLHLAFAELAAEFALSGAFADNPASLGVSRKLGYREDGIERHVVRGKPAVLQRLRLARADWEPRRDDRVKVFGLASCLEMLGLGKSGEPSGNNSQIE